jgi:ABC-type transport system substrate-binding protein
MGWAWASTPRSTSPDNYLWGYHMPGSPRNQSYVNDGRIIELLREQRRTFDVKKRRELVFEAQRRLASQCYYVYGPSGMAMGAWEPYVKNFMPRPPVAKACVRRAVLTVPS